VLTQQLLGFKDATVNHDEDASIYHRVDGAGNVAFALVASRAVVSQVLDDCRGQFHARQWLGFSLLHGVQNGLLNCP
jgi:hypothetical protein